MMEPLQGKLVPIDWKSVKVSDFIPELKKRVKESLERIDTIAADTSEATAENVLHAYYFATEKVGQWSAIYGTFQSNMLTDEIKAIQEEFDEISTDFSNKIMFHEGFFKRLKQLHDKLAAKSDAHPLTKRAVDQLYLDYQRSGALLSENKKKRLAEINQQLAKLTTQFGNNWINRLAAIKVIVSDVGELKGVPEKTIEHMKTLAEKSGFKNKYMMHFRDSTRDSILKFAENRKLREKVSYALAQPEIATKYLSSEEIGDYKKDDNKPILLEIVRLREEHAKLLGYASHAHYRLEERMAKTPDRARDLAKKIADASLKASQRDLEAIKKYARDKFGVTKLEPWDLTYYSYRYEKDSLDFDEEELRPYFEYDKTFKGTLDFIGELYDIDFVEDSSLPVYHETVKSFRVKDKKLDKDIGILQVDPYSREIKQSGAWMNNVAEQGIYSDGIRRPIVSVHFNFDPPSNGQPTLLRVRETETILHEMGHAMHGLFSDVPLRNINGLNVYWDFVEFPSTVMENWFFEEDYLNKIARHYKTGAAVPGSWIAKIKKKQSFLKGMQHVRTAQFALMDMEFHEKGLKPGESIEAFEKRTRGSYSLFPEYPFTIMSPSFGHLFNGGYSAGYYSYLWSETIEADGFEFWNEDPSKRKERARLLRKHILSQGGVDDPNALYRAWRGRDFTTDAFFEKNGLK